MLYKCELPFPPSVNTAFPSNPKVKKGGRWKSKHYMNWLSKVPQLRGLNIKSPCIIFYTFYMPDKRRRDVSNYVKIPEDYLKQQHVIEDDNWHVVRGFSAFCMGIDRDNPRVEIRIMSLDHTFQAKVTEYHKA